MRVELRETGSIRVSAAKEDVIELLQRSVRPSAVRGDRVEAPDRTYVVRERVDGTQVFQVRHESAPLATATRDRAALRTEVQADLYELQRALDMVR